MFERYARNSHKEYDMFMQYIMNSQTSEKVLYLYSTKKRKQEYITKIFNWVDTNNIADIRMWGKSNSVRKIIINNFCGQIMEIEFRKQKKLVKNDIAIIDNIKDKFAQRQLNNEEIEKYFESWNKRENLK